MEHADSSYRGLLRQRSLARVIVSMQVGRTAAAMVPIVLVLYALTAYDSAPLAGVLTLLTTLPGIVGAPLIGTLLDRYGRLRLIEIDYVVTLLGSVAIAVSSLAAPPPVPALIAFTLVLGLTYMFSDSGLRSLFPQLVPSGLWERVNAVDSAGYQVAAIVGPPLAAAVYVVAGPAAVFLIIAVMYAGAGVALIGIREPARPQDEGAQIAGATIDGLRYVWRNRTLRAIALSSSLTNVCYGIVVILVPVVLIDRISAAEFYVGAAFAVSGVAGITGALVIGRFETLGRERRVIVIGQLGVTVAAMLLWPSVSAGLVIGTAWVFASMAIFGFGGGVWDIGLFTVRQRRTDPRLMGRAFAISMALNNSGYPLGAALGGWLVTESIEAAIAVAVAVGAAGTLAAYALVPATVDRRRPGVCS